MRLLCLFLTSTILTSFTALVYKSFVIRITQKDKIKKHRDTISHTFLMMRKFYIIGLFVVMSLAFLGFLFLLNYQIGIFSDIYILSGIILIILSLSILLLNLDNPTSKEHYIGVGIFFLLIPFFLARISYLIYSYNIFFGVVGLIIIAINISHAVIAELILKKIQKNRPPVFGYSTELIYSITPIIWVLFNTVFLILS